MLITPVQGVSIMVRAGLCIAAGVFAAVVAWVGIVHLTPLEAAQPPKAATGGDGKPVDLTALRDAVDAAARKGENVDEVRKALDALEKTAPKGGRIVTAELQALRDAVDAAAKKGENVEAITKELVAVETAVAGRALTKPKPEPQPNAEPPNPFQRVPRPPVGAPELPFPILPNPAFPNPLFPNAGGVGGVGGVDRELFNKAMELRRKAMELMLKDPNDAEAQKEARKLQEEATELLLKAARGLAAGGAGGGIGVMPGFPELGRMPDIGRIPDRARLGIRLERVPPLAVEQLGLEPNTGIAVAMVAAGSVAEKAGLKVHDIILEFAGKAVTDNTDEFITRVNAVKNGEKIDIVLLRKGKKVEVKGIELPAVQPIPRPALPNAANPFRKAADALGAPPAPGDPVKPLPAKPLPPVVPPPNPLP
jgi:hypothetical protein